MARPTAKFVIAAAGDGKSESVLPGSGIRRREGSETSVRARTFWLASMPGNRSARFTANCGSGVSNMAKASRPYANSGSARPVLAKPLRVSRPRHAVNGAEPHKFTYSTILDGSLQVFAAALRTLETTDRPGAFVPHSIKRITLRNFRRRRYGAMRRCAQRRRTVIAGAHPCDDGRRRRPRRHR